MRPVLTQGSAEILPLLLGTLAGYAGAFIIMWEGESRICGSELFNCQRPKRRITCICHLHRLKFLLYICMAHCSHALSPSRWSPTRVGPSRAFVELLRSKISSLLPLHRLQARCTSTRPILSIFGKTCPSLMLLLQPRPSSQVDKVSPVNDGSSWEQREGSKY